MPLGLPASQCPPNRRQRSLHLLLPPSQSTTHTSNQEVMETSFLHLHLLLMTSGISHHKVPFPRRLLWMMLLQRAGESWWQDT